MNLRLLFLSTLFVIPLLAQDRVSVTGAGAKKDAVSLAGITGAGANANLFRQVLQQDLEHSGWFYTDPAAMIKVTGQAADTGNGINAAIRVQWQAGASAKAFNWNAAAGSTSETRRRAHELADEIVQRIKGRRGIASSRILFIKRAGPDNADLFIADADGGNIQQLTHDRRAIVAPKWDTDMKHLFLTSYVSGHPGVYRMPLEPNGKKTVVARYNGLNSSAEPSPDGKSVALILSLGGNPDLYLLNRATGGYTRLTKTPKANEASPTWAPDSRSICYVSDASGSPQLYVLDVATKTSRRITFRGSENVNPDWGPNGITYATRRGGTYQIVVLDSVTSREPDTPLTSGPDHEDPSWAPDGRHIICSRADNATNSSLIILDTMGDSPVRLFTQQGKWAAPEWSYR